MLKSLESLRARLPSGPETPFCLVATTTKGEHGRVAVTRFRQTIARHVDKNAALVLPGSGVVLSILQTTDSEVLLRVDEVFDSSQKASLRVDGRRIKVKGEEVAITPATEIVLAGGFRLALFDERHARPPEPVKIAPPSTPNLRPPRDLVLRGKKGNRTVEGDLEIDGWLEIGRGCLLVCSGNVVCLGATIDRGGTLECKELTANVVSVDNGDDTTVVKVERVRARVVDLVQRALEAVVERGDLQADYCQHFGNELNPCWDYVKGNMPLRDELFERPRKDEEEEDEDAPVTLAIDAIRAALGKGENVFLPGIAPLVRRSTKSG
jgi:hypothetical protein